MLGIEEDVGMASIARHIENGVTGVVLCCPAAHCRKHCRRPAGER